ncbi:prepilin-type N-terminal cleavage/methylation domain-containing protein [Idiomarina sp. M1R2S28]|uniref:Prepilin-type N-terminal cleavage/methylation domain-containing protein n=1 Tax=Idiomarina rhizosphaerae TaxID=2961572 RepID=A0A9X2JSK7_9GAMM|nr:prepilin-type N-terminal cleavage/methylation domain-containing protein [Idiomarina rhizosphaerae]MCP1339928.1 prepilin-type N-terminal cleavage/methylation domain-containing protein [Idiomarina rhizosphaerae]
MRGYSLMELVVALAVSAMLGASALPIFTQQTESLLLQKEAGRWLSYLQLVKARSIANKESIEVDLVTFSDDSEASRIQTKYTYSPSASLTFYGESAAATPGHIRLIGKSRQAKVIISSIGRIRLCLSEGNSLPGIPSC